MLFLIEYSRVEGKLVGMRTFQDSERQAAANARLDLELRLNRGGIDHEVVILDAASEEALLLTHGRYFGVIEYAGKIEYPEGDWPDQLEHSSDTEKPVRVGRRSSDR